jgi:hypothetical protein
MAERERTSNMRDCQMTKGKPKDNRYRKEHLKLQVNIFNKIIEENFPNIKEEIPMNIEDAYRTPKSLDQKKISPIT